MDKKQKNYMNGSQQLEREKVMTAPTDDFAFYKKQVLKAALQRFCFPESIERRKKWRIFIKKFILISIVRTVNMKR